MGMNGGFWKRDAIGYRGSAWRTGDRADSEHLWCSLILLNVCSRVAPAAQPFARGRKPFGLFSILVPRGVNGRRESGRDSTAVWASLGKRMGEIGLWLGRKLGVLCVSDPLRTRRSALRSDMLTRSRGSLGKGTGEIGLWLGRKLGVLGVSDPLRIRRSAL